MNPMRRWTFAVALLLVTGFSWIGPPPVLADEITSSDFSATSWSKVVDFFDYARTYATNNGLTPPDTSAHAYVYTVYVNKAGLQVFYAGLVNITSATKIVTIPMQTFFEHYVTPGGKHAVVASSFVALLAFNESALTLHPGSPDIQDNLWASFSVGYDLTQNFGTRPHPDMASKAEIIPLTSSADGLQWNWGLRYINLAAIWWKVHVDPYDATYDAIPVAFTVYDELTFTYDLTIDPSTHTATLRGNYVIGRMRDLYVFRLVPPFFLHYNSTGTYRLDDTLYDSTTIYDFARLMDVRMSLVLFQRSLLLEQETVSSDSTSSASVTDSDVDVSESTIVTKSSTDSERVFDASFGPKKAYKLYNYTADPSENSFTTHDAVTRTVKRDGFARNTVFATHRFFMKFLPLWVSHVHPAFYAKYREGLLDMTAANYFYIISYPTYGGYRVEHDPTYTSYFVEANTGLPYGAFIIGGIAAAAIGATVYFILRRRSHKTSGLPAPPTAAESLTFR